MEKRDRKRAWTRRGSVAMAVLAAIALGVTVFVAQRALAHASDVVVRGEADALVSAVVADLAQARTEPTAAFLAQELDALSGKGLRYVAVVEHDRAVAEAGAAELPGARLHPGEAKVEGRRVRVAGIVPPHFGHPPSGPPCAQPSALPGAPSPGPHPHFGPRFLVVELEPPVIAQLRGNLARLSLVAAGAAAFLVAFAIALSRSARKLEEVERRAARDERLVALGSMSSVMAHELRNPLASLKGHAQLLSEDLDDTRQKNKAERVVRDAQRLEALTTSLLDFVRDGPIERTTTSIDALVARALEDLPKERLKVHAAKGSLVADEARLARAVHNLVDNALQASPPDATVDLGIERTASEIVITVRDRGPGLPDGAAIFEPFVTTRVRGTGLGLPVARRIAEQHGGSLIGEGHPAGGAVFTLRVPRGAAPEGAGTSGSQS